MKNFISVNKTEEEQVEQIKKWIRENVLHIIIGISLGGGGIWGWNAYQDYQYQRSVEAREYYLTLANNPNNTETFNQLRANYPNSAYTTQASFLMAKHFVKQQNYTKALEHLSPLFNSEDEFASHNAKLRSSAIYLELGDKDQALSVLGVSNHGIFDGLYNHIKGDIYLAKNNIELAKQYYQLALGQIANDELKSIIQIKLNDLN